LGFAQNFSVQAKIDSVGMYIGEQCNVTFEIYQNADIQVSTPIFSDTLISGIEIVERKNDTIVNQDGSLKITQTYLVTSFDSALYYIPPFPFVCGEDTIFSDNLSLKVVSPEIIMDEEQNIPILADIKGLERAPINWQLIKKILLWSIPVWFLLALIIWLIIKFVIKKPIIIQEKPIIKRPAHEIAFEKLEEIRKEKIWQQGRAKEYYTQLTDVLREYLENRFDVPTFEKTSSEIIDSLQFIKKEYSEQLNSLRRIFNISDLVKFAKFIPDINENNAVLSNSESFVSETILINNEQLTLEKPKEINNEEK
jgi:hypothetical protein